MSDDARLEVVLEAKIDKLQASLNKANQASSTWAQKTQQHIDTTDSKWSKLFGHSDPGAAIEKVFSRSRLGLIEEGGAKIGVFGSALEALGPAGLATGAALAAAAIGFEETSKALQYADGLYKVAKNAHVTSDALQELQYALRVEGGDESQAGAALESFSAKLGLATEGAPKALRAFRALFGQAFTAQDAKNLGTADEALLKVTAGIADLKSNSAKDASVEQFGLEGLKPLIEAGPDKMRELRAEAQATGQVLDSSLVQRGHELNEQADSLNKKIKNDLTASFVDLGPVLLGIIGFLAKMADAAANVVDAFQKIENKRTSSLKADIADRAKQAAGPLGLLYGGFDQKRIAEDQAELARRQDLPKDATSPPHGNADLHDLSAHKAGPRDDAAQKSDTVAGELANAEKARLAAELALTQNIGERADFERAEIDAEAAVSTAKLSKERDAIVADKGIADAKKTGLLAALDAAAFTVQATADAKKEAVDRDELRKTTDSQLEHNKTIAGYLDAAGQAQAEIADTLEQRREIALAILADDQRIARIAQKEALDRAVADKSKTPGEAARELQAGDEARTAQRAAAVVQNADPIDKYLHSIQDLNTEFQDAGVNAARTMASGLADAIVNAKNLGEVASSVFRQLVADLLKAVIEKDVTGPILSALSLPGFATGTDFAPGGMAIVGENGPEPVFLPRGARVGTNSTLKDLSSMSVQSRQGSAVVQQFSFDLRGAVMTDDLLRQMNQIGARAAAAGGQLGFQRSMGQLQKARANTLGR